MIRTLRQCASYGLVGCTGLAVGLGILNLLLSLGLEFVLANVLTFLAAVSWNFALNRRFTFPDSQRPLLGQWAEYAGGCLGAAVVNWVVAGALYYQLDFFHAHPNAAALAGVAASSVLNFAWARTVVFRRPRAVRQTGAVANA